jgi:hypothetical protein
MKGDGNPLEGLHGMRPLQKQGPSHKNQNTWDHGCPGMERESAPAAPAPAPAPSR